MTGTAALTLRCHILYANLVFVGHVTKHREDDKPWEETGDAVHWGGQECIPAERHAQQGFYYPLNTGSNSKSQKKGWQKCKSCLIKWVFELYRF